MTRTISPLITATITTIAAAGPLTPPRGAVEPTGVTLEELSNQIADQEDPRTAISAVTTPGDTDSTFRITSPGSYYLTGNVFGQNGRSGIEIAAANVTIDLNGFELRGNPNSLSGIVAQSGANGATIKNGSVTAWPADGLSMSISGRHTIQNVTASENGNRGIAVGVSSIVESCRAELNDGDGITASLRSIVRSCVAAANGDDGIFVSAGSSVQDCTTSGNTRIGIFSSESCTISNSTARANSGPGMSLGNYNNVSNCVSTLNAESGFVLGSATLIENCSASLNREHGILGVFDNHIRNNSCDNNGNGGTGSAIRVTSGDNRIDSNNVTDSDIGIEATTSGNVIIRNTASGNGQNFNVLQNNVIEVINATRTVDPVIGSSGGSAVAPSRPWANISF